jgi:hypothetical protein
VAAGPGSKVGSPVSRMKKNLARARNLRIIIKITATKEDDYKSETPIIEREKKLSERAVMEEDDDNIIKHIKQQKQHNTLH